MSLLIKDILHQERPSKFVLSLYLLPVTWKTENADEDKGHYSSYHSLSILSYYVLVRNNFLLKNKTILTLKTNLKYILIQCLFFCMSVPNALRYSFSFMFSRIFEHRGSGCKRKLWTPGSHTGFKMDEWEHWILWWWPLKNNCFWIWRWGFMCQSSDFIPLFWR